MHALLAMAAFVGSNRRVQDLEATEPPPPDPPEPLAPLRRGRPAYNYEGEDIGYPCPECGSRGWGRYCTGRGHHRRRVHR